MNQEPYEDAWIKKFAQSYGATYPLFHKIEVNGDNAHDVFRYVRRNSKLYDAATNTVGEISWNFGKFLVGEDGKVIDYYLPNANLPEITTRIEQLLGIKNATATAQ